MTVHDGSGFAAKERKERKGSGRQQSIWVQRAVAVVEKDRAELCIARDGGAVAAFSFVVHVIFRGEECFLRFGL